MQLRTLRRLIQNSGYVHFWEQRIGSSRIGPLKPRTSVRGNPLEVKICGMFSEGFSILKRLCPDHVPRTLTQPSKSLSCHLHVRCDLSCTALWLLFCLVLEAYLVLSLSTPSINSMRPSILGCGTRCDRLVGLSIFAVSLRTGHPMGGRQPILLAGTL